MFEDDNPNNFYKNVPPQENTKSASKLLISLGADFGRWRELSNSGDQRIGVVMPAMTLQIYDAFISSRGGAPEFDYKDFPFFVKHFPTVGKSPK
jgi:hypothetical protein